MRHRSPWTERAICDVWCVSDLVLEYCGISASRKVEIYRLMKGLMGRRTHDDDDESCGQKWMAKFRSTTIAATLRSSEIEKTPENLIAHIHKLREWFRFVHQIGYFLSAKLDKLISTSIYIRKCFSNSHNDVCFVCAGTQLCDAQLYLLESGYYGQYRTHRALCRTWNDTAPGYVCHVARLCVCLFGIGECRNFFLFVCLESTVIDLPNVNVRTVPAPNLLWLPGASRTNSSHTKWTHIRASFVPIFFLCLLHMAWRKALIDESSARILFFFRNPHYEYWIYTRDGYWQSWTQLIILADSCRFLVWDLRTSRRVAAL